MKIGFLGTPEISAYVLQELHNKKFDIKWVVTQPDRHSGRGRKIMPPPVKEKALSLGLPVFQGEVFDRNLLEQIKKYGEIDLAVITAYGLYIPTYFIEYPKHSCLNIHFSLLPKYRGSAPVARAIMNGEKEAGVTIMKLVKEMDAGDIVAQESKNIEVNSTTETLTWDLVKIGAELLMSKMQDYIEGKIKSKSQIETGINPTYAQKIQVEEKFIDWNKDAVSIHNKIRALYPWPIAESKINNLVIKFIKTRADSHINTQNAVESNGTIINVDKKAGFFAVKTAQGALLVEKVQPSGKREMVVSEFLNGYELKKGMRFE